MYVHEFLNFISQKWLNCIIKYMDDKYINIKLFVLKFCGDTFWMIYFVKLSLDLLFQSMMMDI